MNKGKAGNIYIGTSGWQYNHWIRPFYPEGLPKKDMLRYYIQSFSTVEINNSFYKLPDQSTFKNWAGQVPSNFIFSVKASRYITHMKKLKNASLSLSLFLQGIEPARNRLGPILFQLPPKWKCNPERLKLFLEILPFGKKYVFEFRDSSWWNDRIYILLKNRKTAFCIFELEGILSPFISTADFVYIRLHGPDGAYQGLYSQHQLTKWAEKIKGWNTQGKKVYCYFDNDQEGFAVKNALQLKQIIANI